MSSTINMKKLTKSIVGQKSLLDLDINTHANNDIAVIGIACRFAGSNNKEEYWRSLCLGEDQIRSFPEHRKRLNEHFLKLSKQNRENVTYYQAGFLDQVDSFDYDFFGISPREASLMSPNQRIFLEVAMEALEDAGYGGNMLHNSLTGIFLGHSTDFGVSYKEFIEMCEPGHAGVSIPGNINSIIASRIAYLLNLKGPSMVVDTACSSSLVTVHQACRSIQNGECDLALAGSVKVDLLPLNSIKAKEDELGITSPDSRARTFDESSEGTGLGEGVAALLLKPLTQAIEDGDNIYCLIKGSAINQDGASAGLTAPNPAAQADVIELAWKNAGIDPETISYIEAHGTGTNLGDPIEINGIELAFSRYTDRKQFCSIGSVKTNVGHLDHAAGMAGLVKTILALKEKMIPASLHFQKPNGKISFETSPVYVNNHLRPWTTEGGVRRCGISSFGLSGTNCHIVLEEATAMPLESHSPSAQHFLTLSAKSEEGLRSLVHRYQTYLFNQSEIDLGDLCYTANIGRGHYSHRIAFIFNNKVELQVLLEKVASLEMNNWSGLGYKFGSHHIVPEHQSFRNNGEITRTEKKNLTQKITDTIVRGVSSLENIVDLYVAGGDLPWDIYYAGQSRRKISIPTYPFARTSCWVQGTDDIFTHEGEKSGETGRDSHPLFSACLVESYDRVTYLSKLSVEEHWILSDHVVSGSYVAPGSVYLELVVELARRYFTEHTIQLSDVHFISPLVVDKGEKKELQTIITKKNDHLEFVIISLTNGGRWIKHAEGKIILLTHQSNDRFRIADLWNSCNGPELRYFPYDSENCVITGERWDCIQKIGCGNQTIMAHLSMKEQYIDEVGRYQLHPALLDEAVNLALRNIGEGLYLPFSYKSMKVYGPLPSEIYSYVKIVSLNENQPEIAVFDVHLLDRDGQELVSIENYSIKRVPQNLVPANNDVYYELSWKKLKSPLIKSESNKRISTLIITSENVTCDRLIALTQEYRDNVIVINDSDLETCISICQEQKIEQIIHLLAFSSPKELESVNQFQLQEERELYSVYYIAQALVRAGLDQSIEIILVTPPVVDNPQHASMFALAQVINQEYSMIRCRCIEMGEGTDLIEIIHDLQSTSTHFWTLYKGGERFIRELGKASPMNNIDQPVTIHSEGVYLITGGAGGLGLEVAQYLASKNKVNIVCINRTPFPPETEWESICLASTDKKQIYKIKKIQQIRDSGSTIQFVSADVASFGQMEEIIDTIRNEYGSIRGVIHAAGMAGDGFIFNRQLDTFQKVVAPKTLGTWILDKLTSNDKLDFFVMFSSITSFLAGQGQGDYAAANAYLDAFTSYRNLKGRRTLSINWTAWKDVGMAHDYGVQDDSDMFFPIDIKDALQAMDFVLNKDVESVIVGKLNEKHKSLFDYSLAFEIDPTLLTQHSIAAFGFHSEKNREEEVLDRSDIVLTGRGTKDVYSELEYHIGSILGSVLGLTQINIYDSFLDLGGNSILAVKVEAAMEKEHIPLRIFDLFDRQTVHALAEKVAQQNEKPSVADDVKVVNLDSQPFSVHSGIALDNIEPFNDVFYKNCFHNSLFPVLKHFGRKLDFFAANDLFWYEKEDRISNRYVKTIRELLMEQGIGIQTRTHFHDSKEVVADVPDEHKDNLKNVTNQLGIYESNSEQHISLLIDNVKEAILNNRLVIAWVDCFYESIRTDTYNTLHWMHCLLVYGFDDEKQILYIIEHKFRGNLTYKPQSISYEDFVRSYEGYLVNYSSYAKMPTFYEFFTLPGKTGHLKENAFELFASNFLNYEDQIVNSLDQLQSLTRRFVEAISVENNLREQMDELLEILNRMISSKEVEMFNAKILLGNHKDVVNELGRVVENWTYVRQIIVKYSVTSIYNIKKSIQRLEAIYPLEVSYYSKLRRLCNESLENNIMEF